MSAIVKPVRIATIFTRANDAFFSSRSKRAAAAAALQAVLTSEGITTVGRCPYCANIRPTVTLCANCGAEVYAISADLAVRHVRESCLSAGLVED